MHTLGNDYSSRIALVSIVPGDGDIGDRGRYRRASVEQLAQVVVKEDALGIEGSPNTPEVVPTRVELGQISGAACVYLAPVWSSLVAFEDFFDMPEIGFIRHAALHFYTNIASIALFATSNP